MSTLRRISATESHQHHGQDHRARRRARILQHADILIKGADHRGRTAARHHLGDEEIAHHDGDDEDGAKRDAALRQRNDDQAHDVEPARARIHRRLDHALVDARHRVEDRHHHEDRQLMHIGDDDGETRIEQERQRLVDEAELQQRAVDQPFLAEQRNPGNHADDVRGPERHCAQQEEADGEQLVAHVEDEEIGDEETQHQREDPDQRREPDRLEIKFEREAGGGDVDVIVEREGRDQAAETVGLEHAGDPHDEHRRDEERDQHQHQRQDVKPAYDGLVEAHRRTLSVEGSLPARGEEALLRQATLKSFQRLFM